MNTIVKKSLLADMKQRLVALQDRNDRDFSGGVQSEVGQIRELEYWIGVIERGDMIQRFGNRVI
jgi:hypothetical protein